MVPPRVGVILGSVSASAGLIKRAFEVAPLLTFAPKIVPSAMRVPADQKVRKELSYEEASQWPADRGEAA